VTRDLMFKDEIRQLVADAYDALEPPGGPGAVLYGPEQIARLPDGARSWMLGVGNPVPRAELRTGERVLDLGCGAGVDALLAAGQLGDEGFAVGIDMLPSMVERARSLAAASTLGNVAFVVAEMEALPLPDGCMDVVVSNGAINLSARKSRVLAEAFRVLRPGGRLTLSDLTIEEEQLPSQVLVHPSAWAG
jgi:arsenite methyltransferase